MEMHFVQSSATLARRATSADFKMARAINEDLVLTYNRPPKVVLDKHPAIGCSILELSKCHMISSYYEQIVPMLDARSIKTAWSDTDSVFLEIETTKSRDECILALKKIMDTSNYRDEHGDLKSMEHASEPGYFKDESGGKFDFDKSISLAPKLYALSSVPIPLGNSVPKAENVFRAKGVSTYRLRHWHYYYYYYHYMFSS